MKYPNNEKLKNNRELHNDVSEFCEWLESQGFEISRNNKTVSNEKIIAEFLGIDLRELEAEKRQMLSAYESAYN